MLKDETLVDGLEPSTSSSKQDPRDADPEKLNPKVLLGEVAIPLTRGFITTVDEWMFEEVNQYRWSANIQPVGGGYFKVYAVRERRKGEKASGKTIYLHRQLLGILNDSNIHGDHLDGNSLRNSLLNLSPGSQAENMQNQVLSPRGSVPKFRGVYRYSPNSPKGRREKPFEARFSFGGNRIGCGHHKTAMEAAIARDRAVLKIHGEAGVPLIATNNTLNFKCPALPEMMRLDMMAKLQKEDIPF